MMLPLLATGYVLYHSSINCAVGVLWRCLGYSSLMNEVSDCASICVLA